MEFTDFVKQLSEEKKTSASDEDNRVLTEVIRSNFMSFCDEIMSMYGSQSDDERLETLSSSSPSEIEDERQKVAYRILWLEALLNESRLELDLINTVLESLAKSSDS